MIAFWATFLSIKWVAHVFIKRNLNGRDLLKKDQPTIAEAMGSVAGLVYFISMILFLPIPFYPWLSGQMSTEFPYQQLAKYLGGLLSILSMIFMGFADDVLDIRWRVKIWLPFVASLPILIVYYVTYGRTEVVLPIPVRAILNIQLLDLGVFYYLFMTLLVVFSTNAINILAGMNGLEGGQALIIAMSIILNDCHKIWTAQYPTTIEAHTYSLTLLIPFVGVTLAYLKYNWYPAKVFGGDTFAYFSGIVIATVAIQAHVSKTVVLFMLPQIFNFLYSVPQLFHWIECPRHRMPRLVANKGLIEYSRAPLEKVHSLGHFVIAILEPLGLLTVTRDSKGQLKEMNNMTIINLLLTKTGPIREEDAVKYLLLGQLGCNLLALAVKEWLASLWY